MKKLALALALTACFGSAQASSLYVDDLGQASNHNVTFSNYSLAPNYTSGQWGALGTTGGYLRFTLLGGESGYLDSFVFGTVKGELATLLDTGTVGSTIDTYLSGNGLIPFFFRDRHYGSANITFANGEQQQATLGFAILKGYGPYSYLLGFNDSATVDADYDDIVIGVSEVPLPAALPLMASGLGLFGLAGFRRKSNVA
jgi:hypothetical protein